MSPSRVRLRNPSNIGAALGQHMQGLPNREREVLNVWGLAEAARHLLAEREGVAQQHVRLVQHQRAALLQPEAARLCWKEDSNGYVCSSRLGLIRWVLDG